MTQVLDVRRTVVPKPEFRDDWLAARRPYFNASYAAALFDRHPYSSPGDVATIKLTGKEQAQTKAMDRGRRLEDVIARWWAETDGGCEVYEPKQLFIAGRMMATVDRFALGGELEDVPVEIKSYNSYAPVPLRYWLDQCQAIMLCVGAPKLALVWFDATMELQATMVEADVGQQAAMLDGAERFMAAIDLGMVPDWVALSYSNQLDLHPEAAPVPVELDDAGYNAVVALATVRSARLAAEREEERIKAQIGGLLGKAESGLYGGVEVIRWANVRGGRTLDTKRLAAEHPDWAEGYWAERPATRRMTLVEGSENAA